LGVVVWGDCGHLNARAAQVSGGLAVSGCRLVRRERLVCAQDGQQILSLAQQSHDVQVVRLFDVNPHHRKASDAPRAQYRDGLARGCRRAGVIQRHSPRAMARSSSSSLVLPYWPDVTRESMYSRMASGKATFMLVLLMGVLAIVVDHALDDAIDPVRPTSIHPDHFCLGSTFDVYRLASSRWMCISASRRGSSVLPAPPNAPPSVTWSIALT